MSDHCCPPPESTSQSPAWQKVLWLALILNFLMFWVEVVASHTSGSMSLKADALDFLGDSFNYAISLYIVKFTVKKRALVSMLKGFTMAGFGLFILTETVISMFSNEMPVSPTMGLIGTLALIVNVTVALLLYKYRDGDSNMQSVWLCTRNDAIGNFMVIIAAGLVYYTQTGWPDWIAGLILAGLGIQSGTKIIFLARKEMSAHA